jgi:hypothetical protein
MLGCESGPDRPEPKDLEKLLPLLGGQPGRAPWLEAPLEGCKSMGAVSQLLGPLADRGTADDQPARDLGLGEVAGMKQLPRLQPSALELFRRQFLRDAHI